MGSSPRRTTTELAALASGYEARIAALEDELAATRAALDRVRGADAPLGRTKAQKLEIFRRLFRGRDDIYARRFEGPERSGYAPVRGQSSAGGGTAPEYARLTEAVLLDHFRGRITVGLYPLLEDNTCRLLVVDFDEGSWETDVAAVRATAAASGLPIAVERSRSGQGAHLWVFFGEPVAAATARRLGHALLKETRRRHPGLGLRSLDRLFPSQDTLRPGGFGNLIALPFQNGPRLQGNTVFVDESMVPHADQWGFLDALRRLSAAEVQHSLLALERSSVLVLEAGPYTVPAASSNDPEITIAAPATVHAVLAGTLLISGPETLPSDLRATIERLATVSNPDFYRLQRARRTTAGVAREVRCALDQPEGLALPRGCLAGLRTLLADRGMELNLDDRRSNGTRVDVRFHGQLTMPQELAARALLPHELGILSAPPGMGKTVVAAWLLAERGVSTLVIIHRRTLLEQWRAQLGAFLELDPQRIGEIRGGRCRPTGCLDVATVQSLKERVDLHAVLAAYGHIIVDECHRAASPMWGEVLAAAPARFVTGLTGTLRRRDGLHPIVPLYCGPVRLSLAHNAAGVRRPFAHRLIVRPTSFSADGMPREASFQAICAALAQDESRNRLIVDDALEALEAGRNPILLTGRVDHVERLAAELRKCVRHVVLLHGEQRSGERRAALSLLTNTGVRERLVLATAQFAGEGLDDPRADTLLLAMPFAWRSSLVQYTGRLHRSAPGKQEVQVYDYVDLAVPSLARMFEKRRAGYLSLGYREDDPAPGPHEGQLPLAFT